MTAIAPNMYAADPGDKRNVTSIRGITTTSYDPAVATYIDGVNQFNLDTYIGSLFDIERIELLRGPQGTLYGRNAMGGVINIITKQPTNNTEASGEVSLGDYGLKRVVASVRVPVVKDKLFFGAAGLYNGLDGFYINLYNNSKYDKQHTVGGNYYLKYLPGNHWAFALNFKHNYDRNNGPFPLVTSVNDAFKDPFMLNQNALTTSIDNTLSTSLSANYAGSSFNFSSQSSCQHNYRYYNNPIDGDFSPVDAITIINNYRKDWNNVKVLTQEFKFTSPASSISPLKWTAGSYLFYQDNPTKQATHFGKDAALVGSPDVNYSLINTTKGKGYGVAFYGQGTYSLSNRLDVIAGARYDYEHKKQNIVGDYQKDPNPT
ncbi:MAG: TonB-dependent receptor, partial [Segetibacter sp.]